MVDYLLTLLSVSLNMVDLFTNSAICESEYGRLFTYSAICESEYGRFIYSLCYL